jgi:mannose/fructose-specific phosphotransferase system component IIA
MNTPGFTHLHAFRELQQCDSAETLTPALHRLCSHFGTVENLVVLTARHEGTKQAICFLRLASETQEQKLMQSLQVGRFGGEVVIVVDLKAGSPSLGFQSHYFGRSNYTSRGVAFQAS